jgi:hypothetical protein
MSGLSRMPGLRAMLHLAAAGAEQKDKRLVRVISREEIPDLRRRTNHDGRAPGKAGRKIARATVRHRLGILSRGY